VVAVKPKTALITGASAGYEGLKRGRIVIIPRLANGLLALGVLLVPRAWVAGLIRRIQKGRLKT
jgi:hypothetical protein